MGIFGIIADGLKRTFKALPDIADDIKLKRIKAYEDVSKSLDDMGENWDNFDPKMLKNGAEFDEDRVKAFIKIVDKAGGPPDANKLSVLRKITEAAGDISPKKLRDLTGSTLGETGDALKKSKSFFEKNKNLLMAGGLSTTGLAMMMLLVNNKSPAAVAGIPKKDLAPGSDGGGDDDDDSGGDDEDDNRGVGGNRKKRVIEGFLKDWGTYIIVFIVIIVIIGLAAFFLSRGSKDTNNALPENTF